MAVTASIFFLVLLCFLVTCQPGLGWAPPSRSPVEVHEGGPTLTRSSFFAGLAGVALSTALPLDEALAAARLDVNNALAREYTGFPGLYPTIATKLVNAAKEQPFKNKKEVYGVLNEIEQERLKQYDSAIVIVPVDKSLQQFKTSQICKYECGGRTSSSFRDEQIKDIQRQRR